MALTRKTNRQKIYNDQECWDKFMEWGAASTCRKLFLWHKEEHGFASQMGPVWAMWRWAADNPELCFPQYKKWYFETAMNTDRFDGDPNVTIKDFLEEIKTHAKGTGNKHKTCILSKKGYKLFCEKWNLEE